MTDTEVRLAAFEWLEAQVSLYDDVLPRTLLAHGFQFQNRSVALLGRRGIWKPQVLPRYPLSISTTPKGPYRDFFGSDGHLRYAYQGKDPENTDNVGLRAALTHQVPLVYFHGVVPGRYLAAWPVYVVGDDLRDLRFTVAVEDLHHFALQYRETGRTAVDDEGSSGRRRYVTAQYRVRLHQTAFRERVLAAYQDQCSLCRLRHRELLDAAHIIPDAEPEGDPVVPNGLALCKLHHAAFDRYFLTVTPEYNIEVRPDILEEQADVMRNNPDKTTLELHDSDCWLSGNSRESSLGGSGSGLEVPLGTMDYWSEPIRSAVGRQSRRQSLGKVYNWNRNSEPKSHGHEAAGSV